MKLCLSFFLLASLSLFTFCLPNNAETVTPSRQNAVTPKSLILTETSSSFNFEIVSAANKQFDKLFQLKTSEVGFEIMGSGNLNQIFVPIYEYTGPCPGRSQGFVKASFFSNTTPPNIGRGVIIKNISRGLYSDPFPYTNRNYISGRNSDTTDITIGEKHSDRFFIVRPGENTFEYEIYEGDSSTVVDRGTFTASVETKVITENRDKVKKEKYICPDGSESLFGCWKGGKPTKTEVYECSDGSSSPGGALNPFFKLFN